MPNIKTRILPLPDDASHKVGKPYLCIRVDDGAGMAALIRGTLAQMAVIDRLIMHRKENHGRFIQAYQDRQKSLSGLLAFVWSWGPEGTRWSAEEVERLADAIGKEDADKMIDQTLSALDGNLHIQ